MSLDEIALSEYGKASTVPSPVNRMMASFASDFRDDKDINLGVGYVNEGTLPREPIKAAVTEVLGYSAKHRLALNYGGPRGATNLIRAIRDFHVGHAIGGLSAELLDTKQIIIGPNGASSLLEAIANVARRGIVVTSDPMYYIYCNLLKRKGFELLAIPEDRDGIQTELLRKRLRELGDRRESLSFIYVVTINNPTCTILSNQRRHALVDIANRLSRELGRQIPLILDKAYEDLIHDPTVKRMESGLLHDESGVVYELGTLSKILAPALRIGYLIGEDGPFLRALVQKTSDDGFSASQLMQEVAGHLLDHHAEEQIRHVNQGYREKARMTKRWIYEYLDQDIEACTGGKAGFYFYLTLKETPTAENSDFFKYLSRRTGDPTVDGQDTALRPRVIYIPGQYCVHPHGELVEIGQRQLRLSYGFEELSKIKRALEIMREAANYATTHNTGCSVQGELGL